jgi:hypothetical protein
MSFSESPAHGSNDSVPEAANLGLESVYGKVNSCSITYGFMSYSTSESFLWLSEKHIKLSWEGPQIRPLQALANAARRRSACVLQSVYYIVMLP